MNAAGAWNIRLKGPMGQLSAVLHLVTDGAAVTGWVKGPLATVDIEDGRIDGDELHFTTRTTKPFPVTAHFTATINGDGISGLARSVNLGNAKLEGTRSHD